LILLNSILLVISGLYCSGLLTEAVEADKEDRRVAETEEVAKQGKAEKAERAEKAKREEKTLAGAWSAGRVCHNPDLLRWF
jgi:hypothetical protein